MFQLCRQRPDLDLALAYMREAYRLTRNTNYRDHYFMTRVVSHRIIETPADLLHTSDAISDEHDFRLSNDERIEQLVRMHDRILDDARRNPPLEWFYSECTPPANELSSTSGRRTSLIELQGDSTPPNTVIYA